jgi:hypothetical protein
MQMCRVLKVTLNLAFDYRVLLPWISSGDNRSLERLRRGYNSVCRGPSTLRNARDDVTLRRSNCWIACCVAFPAPQSSRRAFPSDVRRTMMQLVLPLRSYDNYTFFCVGNLLAPGMFLAWYCVRCCFTVLPVRRWREHAAERVVATTFCWGVQEQQWTPQKKSPSPEADSRSASHEIPLIL